MRTKYTIIISILFFTSFSLFAQKKGENVSQDEKETLVLIETNKGRIKVKLYNDTPIHRDNFLKNIKNKVYDDVLFHRVIKQFMIQAGDLTTKKNAPESELSETEGTIPAEIIFPKYFHKAGQLCAARVSGDSNPEKDSSATQFYIVTGKFYTEMELDKMAQNQGKEFTPEQKEAYMLEGGCPELDEQYTVFGEVVSGMKTVFKIQMVETDENDQPLKDIRIKSVTIVEK